MPPTEVPANKPVKHRACDECRTRKLACSKDPDGCERCKKENITCHYSEQKPMGRPRKRQFIETTMEEQPNSGIHIGALPLVVDDIDGYNGAPFSEPYFTNTQSGYEIHPQPRDNSAVSKVSDGRDMWNFGGGHIIHGPQIDYGNINSVDPIIDPSLDLAPALSGSNPSISGSDNAPSEPLGPCSCLASLYLSLSSLQTLPSDLVVALRTVRGAAATAATCIWCPKCGSVVLENPEPPIEAFQNTMLLGTILPVIANGYQRLLKMVDEEADAAEAAGQTKSFRFQDYGGMCGTQLSVVESMACTDKELLFNTVDMPPHQWRTTVRAMLRVDIYGHDGDGMKHKGLKDLVTEIEFRQRARHDLLDVHLAAGHIIPGPFNNAVCAGKSEQTLGCFGMLNLAKIAIDALVIA